MTVAPAVASLSRDAEQCERLRAAIPPAELRAANVGEQEQLDLTLALLRRAEAKRQERL